MAIFREQLQLIRSPKITITRLANDPRAAFVGFKQIFLFAVLYEFVMVFWAFGDATPTMPAFLKIPVDQYYFYQLIFQIPMILIVWLLAGGIAYVLSKALGGNGSYDTILGGFGIAALVSAYFVLIPDFIQGLLWSTVSKKENHLEHPFSERCPSEGSSIHGGIGTFFDRRVQSRSSFKRPILPQAFSAGRGDLA